MKIRFFFIAVAVVGLAIAGAEVLSSKPSVASIHAFEEPLVAIGGDKYSNYDPALITALQTFQQRKVFEDASAITDYLQANPNSPWKFSLLTNLGIDYRKTGHFSRALDSLEQAWALGKGEKEVQVQMLANRAAAELASLLSSLGRTERLDSLLKEIKGRTIYGSAGVVLLNMNENLHLMKKAPGISFKCGPYALDSIRTFLNPKAVHDPLIRAAKSSPKGFSLTEVRDLSDQVKMNYQMAKRQPGADFIVPSVAHWKSGHYAAILKKVGDKYLTKDPTFNQEILVTPEALEDETSGYFLVPPGPLPNDWQAVSDSEGSSIWGRGIGTSTTPTATKGSDKKCLCDTCCKGMAKYNVFLLLDSLTISDNPVGYVPPVGPDMEFLITYNQLEWSQPALSSSFNFGPCWNCSLLSYITLPASVGGSTTINLRGGGQEVYAPRGSTTTDTRGYVNYYNNQIQGQVSLWVSADHSIYERRMPDGSKEVFSQPSSASSPVYMFLTAIVDSKGNSINFTYDTTSSYYTTTGNMRLFSVTDALGETETLTYGLTGDPLKVTQITDPYGRYATFDYTSYSGVYQLTSIHDVVKITSSFGYGTGSAITSMTTPYGTSTFTASTSDYYSSTPEVRTLNIVGPDTSQIEVDSDIDPGAGGGANPYPYSAQDNPVPSGYGLILANYELQYQNTYYWDKKAMEAAHNDPHTHYTQSHIYHWLLLPGQEVASPVVQCEKPALDSRIWYNYPGQGNPWYEGSSDNPTIVARVVDAAGTTQAWQYQYNNSANPAAVTAVIDPTGRQTNYTYDSATGIDLQTITQSKASGAVDTLQMISYDNSKNPPHCPSDVTDAAGQITHYEYNAQGQITSITPPIRSLQGAEATTYNYTGNYLTSIVGPVSGATTTLMYDTLGGRTINRIKTIADAESYTLKYCYDDLDRVTEIKYPDSTTETFSYFNPTLGLVDLDLHTSTDRLGRTTTRAYDDHAQHLTSITDPKGQTTRYGWCSCGNLISITDPKGNITYLDRDVESRLTSKVYPGDTEPASTPDYTYDVAGRVATYTDKRGDVARYSYNLDNTVSGVGYSVASGTATTATPSESYGYDTYYPRLTSAGGVSISYVGTGTLGALKPQAVATALSSGSATVTYGYDEWGRVVGRDIDGANPQTVTYDPLGRVSTGSNTLGSFIYSYYDPTHPTGRVGSITYPNGLGTSFKYFGNAGDERLQEIKNFSVTRGTLSLNDYTYDAMGKILTWQEQADSNTPVLWTYDYDAADQLTSAVLTNTQINSPAVRSDSYAYDPAGNPTTFNVSGVSRSPSFNAFNQLAGSTPSGNRVMGFTGALNEAAAVTINGAAATVNPGHYFSGTVTLTPGSTGTISVVATDSNGNSRMNHYQVKAPSELTYNPGFDADGNEVTDGAGRTFKWDAKNELTSIISSSGTVTFAYDALGHRIAETDGITLAKQWVWDGETMAEERNAGNSVTKRFFDQGEQISGTSYYFTKDHLGSVREMTDSSGVIVSRLDYDPYGRPTVVSGTILPDMQYAGYYYHIASDLNLTMFRAYDPKTARWLSRDPLGEGHDATLYSYVYNDPIDNIDPLGLDAIIHYSNGTSSDITTGQGFVNAANNSANGSIDSVIVTGHGNDTQQNFNAGDDTSNEGFYYDGHDVYVVNQKGELLGKLKDLLKGKFDPNGQNLVSLTGCSTGSGDDNIASATSKALPGTKVLGSRWYNTGVIPPTNNWIGFPISLGGDKIYVNGKAR